MSYTKNVYHLIFGTHARQRTIFPEHEHELHAYLAGIVQAKGGFVFAINGMEEHVHILCDVPPTISLADFMKSLKQSSSKWAKDSGYFPHWEGWAEGYAEFTCSPYSMQRVLDYVKNQKTHHVRVSFGDELRRIFNQLGIKYEDKYLPK
jgi:REP element-mobilizing transposase RayT